MPNYLNSKIYLIKSPHTDKVYIGATTKKLCTRFAQHRSTYKKCLNLISKKSTRSYMILKYPDCYIDLYESYPCESKEELNKKEREIIELFGNTCVNYCFPGRTRKEYREINKEYIKEKNKEYRKRNKERIKEWHTKNKDNKNKYDRQRYLKRKEAISKRNKEKVTCDVCKIQMARSSYRGHKMSKKHLLQQKRLEVDFDIKKNSMTVKL